MFFRIIAAPPGYAADERYMVAAYESLEFDSCQSTLLSPSGSKFAATIEEARKMIPGSARPLRFEPDCQFLELWEGCEKPSVPTNQAVPCVDHHAPVRTSSIAD